MKRLVPLIFVLTLALGLAGAHSNLESSSIEDGSTIAEAPRAITLAFTEELEVRFSTFKLYPLDVDIRALGGGQDDAHDEASAEPPVGPEEHGDDDHGAKGGHGALDEAAEALVADVLGAKDEATRLNVAVTPKVARSTQVTLTPSDALKPGAYVVMWRTLSVDGHTKDGFLTFLYQPGAVSNSSR